MIGRFDFSKLNENFAAKNPEWLYVSESGNNVNYNGQVLGDVTDYFWDFGDGKFGYDSVMQHNYAKPGFYEVSVLFVSWRILNNQ